jgi:hypothetical protein
VLSALRLREIIAMPTLFSYCVRHDTGAAPNPFWGVCTLVICKPAIRRAAAVGDWIIGTGSVNSPIGDMSGKVVYVMKVTEKMTMQEYDAFTRQSLSEKVPKWFGRDPRRRLGDSIYDFSYDPPKLRKSVHTEENRQKDLGGQYALLSKHFWYFGDQTWTLPDDLREIVKQGPGHRSKSNESFVERFLEWLYGLGLEPNELYGRPQERLFRDSNITHNCFRKAC